jgi:predicted adenine nucleotide alpha hydrolase (AANH) superfamily ATPase
MVAHLCCSVDAGYFLKRLKELYPEEKIIGYFYDPNIHPYLEFKLRSLDTKRICEKLGIEYVEGEYDYYSWFKAVKGKEDEPEKGSRCSICFDHSLEATARFAKEREEKLITTSLLMSPMKSQEQLASVGKVIKRKYDIEFLVVDFRKKGGTQAQQLFAKETQMYRQDYCGCLYGIWQQKQNQEVIDELFNPINNQILPSSIEEKLEFYSKRIELEEKGIRYKIVKENFLNYRLLRGLVKLDKKVIDSYILFYSYLDRASRGKIEFIKDEIGYFNRMQIMFVTLQKLNDFLKKEYKSVKELIKNPPLIEEEIQFRAYLTNTPYNLSPIIVVDELHDGKYEVDIEAKIYPDNKEILIKF